MLDFTHSNEYLRSTFDRNGPYPPVMNVLVYSGPEVLQASLNHALASLKHILLPNYTVQTITQNALTTQPWQNSCALLVLPQSRSRFVSIANKYIKDFVEGGGAYLMLSTDATAIPRSQGLGFGSGGLSFGLEAGESPLKFYDKLNNAYIVCGEEAPSASVEPRVVTVRSADGADVQGIYQTTAAQFKGFGVLKDVFVLAHNDGAIAGVSLGVGKGRAAFWGPSIEYPLSSGSAGSNFTTDEIAASEKGRTSLIASTLSKLGLTLPREEDKRQVIARPLPQFLSGTPGKPIIVSQIMDAIVNPPQSTHQITVFKDENDEFHFRALAESSELLESTREAARVPSDPATWQPKHVVVCSDGSLPLKSTTPLFDIALYFAALASAREAAALPTQGVGAQWGMGEALMYGEAVTSTQTMLDKNPKLLARLPAPLLSIGSHQLAGRGRGSNVWLSPAGCLMMSLTLRISLAEFPASKLVFVQYLFALAVAEACRMESILGENEGQKVRLKWPNDLYVATGPGKEDLSKIGGVLVSTSFFAGKVDIVIGCGVNILNPPSITSLVQLQPESRKTLSMERSAAAIMAKFEEMWAVFVRGGGSFAPFIDLYLRRWLHSDQLVTLTTTTPPTAVRITGITLDHGLLRTLPERAGIPRHSTGDDDYIDLQPDGNSFDLMANLIKTKA